MEELKERLRKVERVLLGDETDLKGRPGVVVELANVERELASVEREVKKTNSILERIMWMVISGVVAGVLALVIRN